MSHRTLARLVVLCLVVLGAACASAGGGGESARAFSTTYVDAEALASIQPPISLYDFLRQHSRVQIREMSGGEAIVVDETGRGIRRGERYSGAHVYLGDREVADPIATIRELSTADISQLRIFTSTEASARYGGPGYTGAIAIQLKD